MTTEAGRPTEGKGFVRYSECQVYLHGARDENPTTVDVPPLFLHTQAPCAYFFPYCQ